MSLQLALVFSHSKIDFKCAHIVLVHLLRICSLMCRKIRKNGLIIFCHHVLTWGLGAVVDCLQCDVGWFSTSVVWPEHPIPRNVQREYASVSFQVIVQYCYKKENLPLPSLSHALQLCQWAPISNNTGTKKSSSLSPTWL